VLINENSNVIVIDFGGGFTDGWVDERNQGTVCEDLQGLEKIVSFMRMRCM